MNTNARPRYKESGAAGTCEAMTGDDRAKKSVSLTLAAGAES